MKIWHFEIPLILIFLFSLRVSAAEVTKIPEVLNVTIIEWCPQICPGKSDKGFLIDIMDEFARREKIKVIYHEVPWSRALDDVRRGVKDIVLSPSDREAAGLILPREEIGTQQMCFYGKKDFKWKYQGPSSIKGKMLIVLVQDASFNELEDFAKKNPQFFDIHPLNDHAPMVKKIAKGQGEILMYTRKSIDDYLKNNPQYSFIEKKGCLSAEKLYMGLRPNDPVWAKKMGSRIDRFMIQARKEGLIDKIMKRYGYQDWR